MSQSESILLLGLTWSDYADCWGVGAEKVLYLSLVLGHIDRILLCLEEQ